MSLGILLVCCLVIGCVAEVKHQISLKNQVSQIVLQQTDKDEMLRLFGPPHRFHISPDGGVPYETWGYWYKSASSNSSNSKNPDLTISFSKYGIVQTVSDIPHPSF